MNVGPLADLKESTTDKIVEQCKAMFHNGTGDEALQASDDDLLELARLAIAATGGHLCVKDGFFFQCIAETRSLKPKDLARWKQKCDDSRGTRRNVMFRDGMLRVRDDAGRLAPLVPGSISREINRSETEDYDRLFKEHLAPFVLHSFMEQTLAETRGLPAVSPERRRRRGQQAGPS